MILCSVKVFRSWSYVPSLLYIIHGNFLHSWEQDQRKAQKPFFQRDLHQLIHPRKQKDSSCSFSSSCSTSQAGLHQLSDKIYWLVYVIQSKERQLWNAFSSRAKEARRQGYLWNIFPVVALLPETNFKRFQTSNEHSKLPVCHKFPMIPF